MVPELAPPVEPDDEPPIPVEPEPRPPELEPDEPVAPEPVEPEPVEPEPMLPELELPVLPEPDVPYCLTQSSRDVPVRPTHWLGVAEGLEVELPLAPVLLDPLPVTLGLLVELSLLPVALGLVVELPLLPEVCAHDAAAMPSRAAATAALSVFAITMYSLG